MRPKGKAPFERCVFLLFDGARPDILEELVARGKLPNIAKVFLEEGEFRYATSAFPTTTGPAYFPFLTGCLPGTCNIPGIRWLDRAVFSVGRWNTKAVRSYVGLESYLMNRDLSPDVRTLFELLRPSRAIFSVADRGVSSPANGTRLLRTLFGFYAKFSHHWALMDRAAEFLMLRAIARELRFLFVVFYGIDEVSHLSDPNSPKTLEAYLRVDRALGRLKSALQKRGLDETTLLVATSDHGMTQTTRHLELWKVPENKDFKTLYYPMIHRRNVRAACMVSGNAMANLYFRNGSSWEEPVFHRDVERWGFLEELLSRPEIDQVITRRGEGEVVVSSRRGRAVLKEDGRRLHYQQQGGDPFGFEKLPEEMTWQESLDRTFRTKYPDALLQAAQLFRSSRTGDIVVTAAPGYDLRDRHEIPEHFSSHGSLVREHMMVPLMFNTKLKSRRNARTADVFPTVLELLGEPVPGHLDGRSLMRT